MIVPTLAWVFLLSFRISSFMPRTSAPYVADEVNPFNKKPYLVGNDLTMRHLLILAFACISLSSTAQVIDTTMTGNAMHMNLNLSKLDSTISAMQEIIEAQQAEIESLQAGSFDGNYNSLSNLPTQKELIETVYTLFNGDLSGADLSYASLANANLANTDLSSADLSSANISSAWLPYANLLNANLSGADLSYTSLANTNLSGADLSYANLTGANVTGANKNNANWTGANIFMCIGCTCVDADNDNYCD